MSYKEIIKSLCGSSFRAFFKALDSSKGISLILMYHRVVEAEPEGLHDPAMFVTAETLGMHIKELSRFFDIVPLEKALEPGDGRLCALTFDDGWLDNYEVAFPVLTKHNAPATIFLPVDLIGGQKDFWFEEVWESAQAALKNGREDEFIRYMSAAVPLWRPERLTSESIEELIALLKSLDPLRLETIATEAGREFRPAYKAKIMGWDHVLEMGGKGISFGSHGLSHRILTGLDKEERRREIESSARGLSERGVADCRFLSYPNGDCDPETAAFAKEAGYIGAVTTRLGCNHRGSDPFLLNRVPMHDEITKTPALLWFRLMQALGSREGRR